MARKGKSNKRVKRNLTPSVLKVPKKEFSPESFRNKYPAWRISTLDMDGPWGWNKVTCELFFDRILPRLKSYETMYWKEIINGSHDISVSNITRRAQKRLSQIISEDIDDLFSLRIAGKQRLWGIRVGNVLKILWWDPNHEVCPSLKKHT